MAVPEASGDQKADLHVASDLDELRALLDAAQPGDVIEVADGVYRLSQDIVLREKHASGERPIVIRAANRLKAEFVGRGGVLVEKSDWVTLEGFKFAMNSDPAGKNGVVELRNCRHCRVTRNHFELDESETNNGDQYWLRLAGDRSENNRIDHNLFQNKRKKGAFLLVSGSTTAPSRHDLVERNHFKNRYYGGGANGYETLRVGQSEAGNKDGGSSTTIRENLFENASGEDEIVSCKVGDCAFLGNTVLDCHGSVVFRTGNRDLAEGNYFLNTHAPDRLPFKGYGAGGLRLYGSDHKVLNNYFEGLNGSGLRAPLNVMHGAPAGSGALGGADALPSVRCVIAHNAWVRCRELRIGVKSDERPLKPAECVFSDNVIYGNYERRPLLDFYQAEGVKFSGNILWPATNAGLSSAGWEFRKDEFETPATDPGSPSPPRRLSPGEVGPDSQLESEAPA